MPELPEVETVARGVDKRVRGDRIQEVWLGSHREPFKTPQSKMAKGLEGRTILAVHRIGNSFSHGAISDRKVQPFSGAIGWSGARVLPRDGFAVTPDAPGFDQVFDQEIHREGAGSARGNEQQTTAPQQIVDPRFDRIDEYLNDDDHREQRQRGQPGRQADEQQWRKG